MENKDGFVKNITATLPVMFLLEQLQMKCHVVNYLKILLSQMYIAATELARKSLEVNVLQIN